MKMIHKHTNKLLAAAGCALLTASAVADAPRVIRVEPCEPCICNQPIRSLVWVQPAEWRKAKRPETLPILTGDPSNF